MNTSMNSTRSGSTLKNLAAWFALAALCLTIVIASCFAVFTVYETVTGVLHTAGSRASFTAAQEEPLRVTALNNVTTGSAPQAVQLSNSKPSPDVLASGRCGKRVSWALDDAGTLYIWGTGAMYDYKYSNPNNRPSTSSPWDSMRNEIQFVVISDKVTRIGDRAFSYCKNLMSVDIPDSVTSIGESAFRDCDNLYEIALPDDITKISKDAFYHCEGLETVTMPENLVRIEEGAFRYCRALTDLVIPSGVTKIGHSAFEETKLESVTISSRCKLGYKPFPGDCVVFYN